MKKSIILSVMIALGIGTCLAKGKEEPMSVRMVKSEIGRMPDASMIDYNTQLKWNYTHGLELQAMIQCAQQYSTMEASVWDYVTHYVDTIIASDGTIVKYKKTNYTLDHINPGKMLILAYERLKQPRMKTALDTLYSQLLSHPRVAEGGFWHKKAYPNQMWLDGIYMEAPFYAEYASRYLKGEEQAKAFDDVVNQITTVAKHTYDPQCKLYRHAWDEKHLQPWSHPENGQAPHVWGRALGWYCMAMVDVLSFLPENHAGRESILKILQPLCKQLRLMQEPNYGAWYQVMDQGQRDGNYLETSCTAMFAYTFLKGAKNGWLPKEYWQYGVETIEKLNRYFVREDADGSISLTRVCGVAGLGGTPYRSGDYDYYIHEIIRDNDPKGVGPYIMASLLIEAETTK